ncbi:MAG: TRAP transporter small permease [Gammaproteobacteria bacterium]|nr:MAG: TRAP transporter small permease [Gammaproteobacteria bacterium]
MSAHNNKGLDLLLALIKAWALLGGLLLLAVVLMTTYSTLAGFLISQPFPGDFELTQMGVAVAVFSFLPYCQLTFSNVSADIFTSRAGPVTVRNLNRLGSLIALFFSTFLIWRMYAGMLDYQIYREVTTILQIPLWYAFVPALFSLLLLLIASLITLRYPQGSINSPLTGI